MFGIINTKDLYILKLDWIVKRKIVEISGNLFEKFYY